MVFRGHREHGVARSGDSRGSAYRRQGRPILLIGWLFAFTGIGAIISPPVGRAGPGTTVSSFLDSNLEIVWQAGYAVGGILMVVGVLFARPATEVVGLWLAEWALGVNIIAALAIRGPFGVGLALLAYLLAAWVLFGRIQDLHRAARAAQEDRRVKPDPGYQGPERRL